MRSDAHPSRTLQIFLCHASGDKAAVRDLYRLLRNDGMRPWLDEEDLLPGQRWEVEIPKAVRFSDIVLVCLSHASITKRGYVQKEIGIALDAADEQPENTIFLIPVRLEACPLPERLRHWQRVDVFREDGYARLLRSLQARATEIGAAKPGSGYGEASASSASPALAEDVSKQARLVQKVGGAHSVIPWSRSGDDGTLGVRLFNEGPAIARDVQLSVTLPGGRVRQSEAISIRPEQEQSPSIRIHQSDFTSDGVGVVGYRVTWRDGNGLHEMAFDVRIEGAWFSDWRSYRDPARIDDQ